MGSTAAERSPCQHTAAYLSMHRRGGKREGEGEAERQRGREAERQRGREAERRRGGEAERWRRAPQMCDARALSPRAGARAPRLPHLGGDQRGDGADWDVSKTGFSKAGFMDVCSVTFDVSVYAMGAPRVD